MNTKDAVDYLAKSSKYIFMPTRDDYADFKVDVEDSFNWQGIFEQLKEDDQEIENKIALFIFRSIRRARVDDKILKQLDDAALLSAESAKGFIHYEPFEGLSYCLWQTPEDARAAISSPDHVSAARYAEQAYAECHLVRGWLLQSPVDGRVDLIKT